MMTLLEIKNHLYSYFLGQTVFDIKGNINDIKLGSVYDDKDGKMFVHKETLIRSALADMVKSNILIILDENVYMLTQPLNCVNQAVSLSPYTCSLVAHAFNSFTRQASGVPYVANKMAITDIEIQAVVHVCFAFYQQIEEMSERIEELSEGGDFDITKSGG